MAMVVVMAALVGAGLWVAIRVENGLDARPGPGRGPVHGRRCTLGHDRMTAARRHARSTPPAAGSGVTPVAPRSRARCDGLTVRSPDYAVVHSVRQPAGPATCPEPDDRIVHRSSGSSVT